MGLEAAALLSILVDAKSRGVVFGGRWAEALVA
jgi:hypothetical protein